MEESEEPPYGPGALLRMPVGRTFLRSWFLVSRVLLDLFLNCVPGCVLAEIAEVRSVHSCALPSGTIQRGQNEVRIRVTKASGLARLRPIVLRELKLHIKYGL